MTYSIISNSRTDNYGTKIKANKPVVAIAGCNNVKIPHNTGAADPAFTMGIPTAYLGHVCWKFLVDI